MRNTLLIVVVLLSACVAETPIKPIPSEFLRADNCINSDRVEIFQYDENTTLMEVYICQDKLTQPGEKCKNFAKYNGYRYEYDKKLVAIDTKQFIGKNKEQKEYMFDGSVIGLSTHCIVPDGIHSYVTPMGVQKTVQKVKILDSYKSRKINPEYEIWKAEQDKKAQEDTNQESSKEQK